jgi:hypothetical protein
MQYSLRRRTQSDSISAETERTEVYAVEKEPEERNRTDVQSFHEFFQSVFKLQEEISDENSGTDQIGRRIFDFQNEELH